MTSMILPCFMYILPIKKNTSLWFLKGREGDSREREFGIINAFVSYIQIPLLMKITKKGFMGNEQVNAQITDAVTGTNMQTISSSPALAMSSLYQATSQALANAAHNAALAQQQAAITAQAATAQGVALLYSIKF